MKPHLRQAIVVLAFAVGGSSGSAAEPHVSAPAGNHTTPAADLSPTALVATPDASTLFIACATARRVVSFDLPSGKITHEIDVPAAPIGLAITKDGSRLYVACAAPHSTVCVVDVATHRIAARFAAGHTAMSPVLSPDEKTLYVCNRFNHDLSVIELPAGRETRRISVSREPVAAGLTRDGRHLIVANHLQAETADNWDASTKVSVIDTAAGRVIKEIPLSEGAGFLRGVAISPDGRFAAVTFVRARYWLPTRSVELGGINGSAVAVLDLQRLWSPGTVLLDQATCGHANPWAVAWTADSKRIVVSHAGTHELSLVDARSAADRFSYPSVRLGTSMGEGVPIRTAPPANPVRVCGRVSLAGQGPRALAVVGSRVYAANYFSDNLSVVDLDEPEFNAGTIALAVRREESIVRKGERLFNDATLCFQGWQSCASCHDADARVDGFDWDMLNDGVGNPKSTKSLVWAHRTPPCMASGVRSNAEGAVRAGIRHALFSPPGEEIAAALDAYLRSLEPAPSPHLMNGRLSAAAERGRQLFLRTEVGCAHCHPPGLFTDLGTYDVGTAGRYDRPNEAFDTPTLVELWRTGPYLHDGSAVSIRDVLTRSNRRGEHGATAHLSPQEIEDLSEYLLSL